MRIDKKELEGLAFRLSEDFLKTARSNNHFISLYGQDDKILEFLKTEMEKYFECNGEEVIIRLKKNQGYRINVGVARTKCRFT